MADNIDTNSNKEKNDIEIDKKDVAVVATLNINSIFEAMHKKAEELAIAAVGNVEIVNSAINDKGKFLGAGQHVIIALTKADDLIKEDCLKAIQTYVTWFSGPDISKLITLDSLTPLTRPLTDEEKNKDLKKAQDDKETNAKNNNSDNNSDNKLNKNTENNTSESLVLIYGINNNLLDLLFESTQEQDETDAKQNGLKITGYLNLYLLDIPGLKTSMFKDAIKNVGKFFKDMIGDIAISKWDWRSGASKDKKTLKDIKDKILGKLSPEKVTNAVKTTFNKKFLGNTANITTLDSKSIINHLSKRLLSADKGKISKIPFSLCIKVDKNDKNYELLNKKVIAKIVSDGLAVKDLGLNTPPKFSENDVILVNNYNDLHYNPDANKHGLANANAKKVKTKEENSDAKAGVSNESVEDVFKMYKMIFENLDLTDLENYVTLALFEDKNNNISAIKENNKKQKPENVTELGNIERIVKEKEEREGKVELLEKDKSTKLEDKDYEDIASKIKLFIIDNNLENEKEKLENLKNNSNDELDKAISLLLYLYKSSNKKTDITGDRLKNKIDDVDFNKLKLLRDNTDGYLTDLLIKLNATKKFNNKNIRLKMAIMPIKFRYIKFRVDKLKEKGYYKPEGKFVDFDVPTNLNTLNFISRYKSPEDNKNETDGRYNFTKKIYNELNKQIPISDDEVKKFEEFTNKDFEQARNNVLDKPGKPALIALEKLAVEIKDKFDKIKDEKTKQKLFPGVNGKKELEKKLDDKNSNIWDLGVTRMFEVLDDINQKEADREGNKQALDKTKTEKDMYIIPIKNISTNVNNSTEGK